MAIIKNVSKFKIPLDDFWNTNAKYDIRPGQQVEILDNIYVTSKKVKQCLRDGSIIEILSPQFDSKEVGDWWDKDVRVENIPGTKLDTTPFGYDYLNDIERRLSVNARGELIVDTELTIDEVSLNVNNVFPARFYEGEYPFAPGTDVLLSVNAYGELELAREYFNSSGLMVSIDAGEDSVLSYGSDYESVPSIWPMKTTNDGHLHVNIYGENGLPVTCGNPLYVWLCSPIAYNIEYPSQATIIATDEDGRIIRDTTPLHGTNPTIELGFNALDQLVQIRKLIKGAWQVQRVSGSDVADETIVRTRTFHAYI